MHESAKCAQTHKPGDTVPQTGVVECLKHRNDRQPVTRGTQFQGCQADENRNSASDCELRYL